MLVCKMAALMKMIDVALTAAKKRKSPHTGLIHHCYEDGMVKETIPLFENFCFALALFRTRLAENVLEGRALLTRLFAFQVGSNFPVYLHEFPDCRDQKFANKLYPILFWLNQEFRHVLGDDLRAKVGQFLAAVSAPTIREKTPATPEALAEFMIASQVQGASIADIAKTWDPFLCCYKGTHLQEGYEPAVTLYDLFLGEFSGRFSKRALQDHPIHLRASLVYPCKEALEFEPRGTHFSFPYLWGGPEQLHSLVCETKGEYRDGNFLLLDGPVEEVMEIALYCDAHPSTELFVNGRRANTFCLGDEVVISSGSVQISLSFTLIEGQGRFWGHIFRSNRPGQLKNGMYDWKIGVRTVKREGPCVLKLTHSLNAC